MIACGGMGTEHVLAALFRDQTRTIRKHQDKIEALADERTETLRTLKRKSKLSHRELAKLLGVSKTQIGEILHR